MRHTKQDAIHTINHIINLCDCTDALHYDLDAIAEGVHDIIGSYNVEDMDETEFWKLVEDNDLSGTTIEVHTIATSDEREDCVMIKKMTRQAALPLDEKTDLSADDIGCEPGDEFRIEARTPDDDTLLDSYDTTAD